MDRMVLRVKPTPTRFPNKSLYPEGLHTIAFYTKCAARGSWILSSHQQVGLRRPSQPHAHTHRRLHVRVMDDSFSPVE